MDTLNSNWKMSSRIISHYCILCSDSTGNLLFHTDGRQLRNRLHQVMEGGDVINPGQMWVVFYEWVSNCYRWIGYTRSGFEELLLSDPYYLKRAATT
jgi:hypothetical protein